MDKYINCKRCGKQVKRTGRCQKYCPECAVIVQKENVKKSNERFIEKRRALKANKEKVNKSKISKKGQVKKAKDNTYRLKDCKYYCDRKDVGTCNYLSMVGHSRGCPVQGCIKYEPGKRKRKHGNPLSVMEG